MRIIKSSQNNYTLYWSCGNDIIYSLKNDYGYIVNRLTATLLKDLIVWEE